MTKTDIHETAVVHPQAILGEEVKVEPYAIVEAGAKVGKGTVVESHAIIKKWAIIGESCTVGHFSVLGGLPQHLSFDSSIPSFVKIGNGVRVGEGVTVHRSIHQNKHTEVGNNCFLMGNCHVAHDCSLDQSVVLANGVLLGGHVQIGKDVFVGGGAAIHQFVRVGDGAMIGGLAEISLDVAPQITAADRNIAAGLNLVGLKRRGVNQTELSEVKKLYLSFLMKPGNLTDRANELLSSTNGPKTDLGISFVKFFLSGDRNFVRSRSLQRRKIIENEIGH